MTLFTVKEFSSNPGITPLYKVKLKEKDRHWEKTISPEEYQRLVQAGTFDGKPVYNFTALFMPIRTNNLSVFLEDLCLPLVFNLAIKVDGIGLKIITIFFAGCIDLITLPIRLITALPRCRYKQVPRKEHLFYKFLLEKGFDKELLEKIDCCSVELLKFSKDVYKDASIGAIPLRDGFWTVYQGGRFKVNFIEQAFVVPQFVNFEFSIFGSSFGSEVYKKCYLEAYPHITEHEFKKIEDLQNEYLKVLVLKGGSAEKFLEELKKYIPEVIEKLSCTDDKVITPETYQKTYKKLKKAYRAFALKYHPDKGGNAEIFVRINNEWEKLNSFQS